MDKQKLNAIIRNIPNFPQKGINYKDITPILSDPEAFNFVVDQFCHFAAQNNVTAVVAPEARGFIFAAAVAYKMKIKFVPARKPNKLPCPTFAVAYDLEYSKNKLEIHQDSLCKTDKVIIIDDLIATSGTINACITLVAKTGASVICIATLITLIIFSAMHKFCGNKGNTIPLLTLLEM